MRWIFFLGQTAGETSRWFHVVVDVKEADSKKGLQGWWKLHCHVPRNYFIYAQKYVKFFFFFRLSFSVSGTAAEPPSGCVVVSDCREARLIERFASQIMLKDIQGLCILFPKRTCVGFSEGFLFFVRQHVRTAFVLVRKRHVWQSVNLMSLNPLNLEEYQPPNQFWVQEERKFWFQC